MRIGLKVDVATLRGTREGVPNLVEIFRAHDVAATFFFALGPDRTSRATRRALRHGYAGKMAPTPAAWPFGLRRLLPGLDIGRRAGDVMRAVRDVGHETGAHCHDYVRWQEDIADADDTWTRREMTRACEHYVEVFGEPPRAHAAAGWKMNLDALRLTQRLGFDYCSDGRGEHPHLPVWRAELIRCPQFPTTLPTLDELLGADGLDEHNVVAHVLGLTSEPVATGHVFTVSAEFEGLLLAPVLGELIDGWKAQGWQIGPLRSLVDETEPLALPRCETGPGSVAGRRGTLLMQGPEFLADFALVETA
jgi:peptidoglycan/xylan/chitin deacetylase (PgdA/CDA1 family)